MTDKPLVRPHPPSGISLSLGDIYHILFRHKWKITAISAAGLLIALLLPVVWHLPYQSEAKLFIRYVPETKSPGQIGANDARVKSPDERGETIINTELEILTSVDIAQQVADAIGPQKLLAKAGGGNDRNIAAAMIHLNLLAEVPKKSSVIRIVFQHPNPEIVQSVLDQVIKTYRSKHAEIHRVGVFDDFLTQETDQLKSRLAGTEEDLRKAKAKAGVLSLEDSKKVFTEQNSKIQQQIFDAEAELAERKAAVNELSKLLHAPVPVSSTNASDTTNEVNAHVADDTLTEYQKVSGLLESLHKNERELLVQFKPASSLVKPIHDQIESYQALKRQLEKENPELLSSASVQSKTSESTPGARIDLTTEATKVTGLEAKIRVLMNQLAGIRTNAAIVDMAEASITELQRRRESEEANYKYFAASKEQSLIDDALGAGRVSNISPVQAPPPPFRDRAKQLKVQALALFGSLAAALALAFLIELYFDRSLKRPAEIETRLGLPLFLSIPLIQQNGNKRLFKAFKSLALLRHKNGNTDPENAECEVTETEDEIRADSSSSSSSGLPADIRLFGTLTPFFEALRDRLIGFFEIKDLTHKPKLVAVTSCGEGSGVTTIAAGLAASLSETGDGNVLLVDMNQRNGAAHHFYNGRLDCGLDDALELGKRDGALVQENLYVVSETGNGNGNGHVNGHSGVKGNVNGDKLPRILPRRFTNLVPKLKASDYDRS